LQTFFRDGSARGLPADRDDFVKRRYGNKLPLKQMSAFFRFAEQEFSAAANYSNPVAQELFQDLFEVQGPRPAFNQGR
jgi:hypothetical protein